MKKIIILLTFILLSCGKKGKAPEPAPEDRITQEQTIQLLELKEQIKEWAPTCVDLNGKDYYACGEGDDDGDSVLWMGLLCLSGELEQCQGVKDSQDLETGRMGRSPVLIETKTENEYSRDMFLGELAYLIEAKDTNLAESHLKYISKNNNTLCENPTDNRCNLNPLQYRAIWGLMKRVWRHMGLTPTFNMEQGDIGDDILIKLQSQFSPGGFQLHLVAVEIWLRQQLDSNTSKIQEAAHIINGRQNGNPFFEYVANGATKRAAELTLQLCPKERPEQASQWAWQRSIEEQAWLQSKGWDCIFLINLLTK